MWLMHSEICIIFTKFMILLIQYYLTTFFKIKTLVLLPVSISLFLYLYFFFSIKILYSVFLWIFSVIYDLIFLKYYFFVYELFICAVECFFSITLYTNTCI